MVTGADPGTGYSVRPFDPAGGSASSPCPHPFEPEETPAAGDEALAYRGLVTPENGTPGPVRTTVVRHGDVIVLCTAVGGARIARPALLTPVLAAQDAKPG
ncbi:hypothetical protein ACFYOA_01065 [Streptomyces iakyrus]|uniref:hypothetical protein n=1 Tax=Streptomyces iakyrus TaxID=68219 RepID=UPI00367A860A